MAVRRRSRRPRAEPKSLHRLREATSASTSTDPHRSASSGTASVPSVRRGRRVFGCPWRTVAGSRRYARPPRARTARLSAPTATRDRNHDDLVALAGSEHVGAIVGGDRDLIDEAGGRRCDSVHTAAGGGLATQEG